MRDYDLNQAQCNPTPKLDYYRTNDFTFCTQRPPEYIIPLVEVKNKSNEMFARNTIRNQLFECQHALIQIIEVGKNSLNAADRKEFKELFQNLVNEI